MAPRVQQNCLLSYNFPFYYPRKAVYNTILQAPYDDDECADWATQEQQEQGIFIELNQMYEK